MPFHFTFSLRFHFFSYFFHFFAAIFSPLSDTLFRPLIIAIRCFRAISAFARAFVPLAAIFDAFAADADYFSPGAQRLFHTR